MAETSLASSRNLTKNDVLVIRNILAGSLETEEDRIRKSGIPRSTYLSAKMRIYSSGILEDRYVPSPQAVGAHSVSFLMTRPFTEARVSTVETLCNVQGAVLAWSGIQSIMGVVFHQSEGDAKKFRELAGAGDKLGKTIAHVEIPSGQFGVPVYFDYEGAWNHFAGMEGSARYPRALPHYPSEKAAESRGRTRIRDGTDWLLKRPFHEGIWKRPSHLLGPGTLTRSQRRLLASGAVEWRTFLCIKSMPGYDGQSISNMSLVSGEMNDHDGLLELFRDLTEVCGIYPFLLASDGTHALIGILAGGSSKNEGTPGLRKPRAAVFPVVSHHLANIEIVREPISNLVVHRSHRYDVLVP
jgi:hypothetical protein